MNKTPTHYSVLLHESIKALLGREAAEVPKEQCLVPQTGPRCAAELGESIAPLEPQLQGSGVYVDATYGRGGHAAFLLSHLGPQGRLILFDQDPRAIADAQLKYANDPRVTICHDNFTALYDRLAGLGLLGQVDGLLFDLGVSSPQLDEAERGFSFLRKGPLDMRMNDEAGLSLLEKLKQATPAEVTHVLKEYGEERFAHKIATAIFGALAEGRLNTTADLAREVEEAIPKAFHEHHKHPATRSFQALRIWVNQELESVEQVLKQVPAILKIGGRVAFISFHSLEDRLVKNAMQKLSKPNALPRGLPIKEDERSLPGMRISIKMQKPSAAELAENPRSRSAILRVMERIR